MCSNRGETIASDTRICDRICAALHSPSAGARFASSPSASKHSRSHTGVASIRSTTAAWVISSPMRSQYCLPGRLSVAPTHLSPYDPAMPDYITLPEQRVPVVAECDVLVVGGGSAGMSAAIAAARQGADVILVERYGYLGGLASGGLIVLLLTLDDGNGKQVVAGQCQELVERLEARDACFYPPKGEWGDHDEALVEQYRRWGLVWGSGPHRVRYSVAYDPEEFKFVANEWVAEAKVRLMFHRWASDIVYSLDRPHGRPAGRVTHVVFTSKAGRQAVKASYVIDATGDGDVFTMAGEPSEKEQVHPWLWFRMAGVRDIESAQSARGSFFFRTVKPGQALMPWGAAERIERRMLCDRRSRRHRRRESAARFVVCAGHRRPIAPAHAASCRRVVARPVASAMRSVTLQASSTVAPPYTPPTPPQSPLTLSPNTTICRAISAAEGYDLIEGAVD